MNMKIDCEREVTGKSERPCLMTFGLHTRAAGAQPAIVPFAFLFPGFLIARAPFFTNWKISRYGR